MLEFDDIQHILLTRTPAITGRYEFLTFDTPAGGRAWLSELIGQDTVRRGCRRHHGRVRPLGHAGVHVERPARTRRARRFACRPSPRSSARAWRPAPTSSATPAPTHRDTGWAAWPETTCTRSRSCSRARRRAVPAIHRANTTSCSPAPTACAACRILDLNATPPFNYAHDHFGFRDRLSQPVMKGSGEEPTPGSGAPLEPGEFILGYPDEDGPAANLPEPRCCRATAATWPTAGCRNMSAAFRDYLRGQRRDPGGAGAAGGEVHGPLAQRRPAGAGAGQRRPRAGRRPDAQQRLQLQGDGSVRIRVSRSARTRVGSIRATPRTT